MEDTDMTSDFLIYNILKKSDDKFIENCNVKFIDQSVPAEEDETIYIANVDLEPHQEMFDGVRYKALVNIYVKTKSTDYLNGSRYLRSIIKHIKKELKSDIECKKRNILFRNTNYEYGSKYTLKGMHLLVQLYEFESFNDDEEYECITTTIDKIEVQ